MTPIADKMREWLDKRTLPICQEAAKAFDPYFDRLGPGEVEMAMMPLQMLFMFANGKDPDPETIDSAIQMGAAQSGIPASVLRLHAECLFGQSKKAKPSPAGNASDIGGGA
jgi:hypothetical protein